MASVIKLDNVVGVGSGTAVTMGDSVTVTLVNVDHQGALVELCLLGSLSFNLLKVKLKYSIRKKSAWLSISIYTY